jgi:hypothetical protein
MFSVVQNVNPLRTEVYFGHHNVKIKNDENSRSSSKPLNIGTHCEAHSDWDSLGANVSFLEFFSKYPRSLNQWICMQRFCNVPELTYKPFCTTPYPSHGDAPQSPSQQEMKKAHILIQS